MISVLYYIYIFVLVFFFLNHEIQAELSMYLVTSVAVQKETH